MYETEIGLKIRVHSTSDNGIIVRDNIKFAKCYDSKYGRINHFSSWPVVYIIYNKNLKISYIGQTTDLKIRLIQHYNSGNKSDFVKNGNTRVLYIDINKANSSLSQRLEHDLIKNMDSDGLFDVKNSNAGFLRSNYYEEGNYEDMFKEIWKILCELKMARKNYNLITAEEYTNYSPYLALNNEQYLVVNEIVKEIVLHNRSNVVVKGSAGTGKTVLAIHLLKLFYAYSRQENNIISEEMLGESLDDTYQIKKFFDNIKNIKIGIIIPAANLNSTLSKYIREMVRGKERIIYDPNSAVDEVVESGKKFDILIVDETQSLVNPNFSVSNQANEKYLQHSKKLKLKVDNQLEWIYQISDRRIYFYDSEQRIRKGCIDKSVFDKKLKKTNAFIRELTNQERCINAGKDYIDIIKKIFDEKTIFDDDKIKDLKERIKKIKSYKFINYTNALKMANDVIDKNGRVLSGYSWESKEKERAKYKNEHKLVEKYGKYSKDNYDKYYQEYESENNKYFDVVIGEYKSIWNQNGCWINRETSKYETGCVYVVGGLNLDFAGVIIGKEIILGDDNMLKFVRDEFKDVGAKRNASDEEIFRFALNVYYILLTRGRNGTFVYAVDSKLQELLSKIMKTR